MLGLVSWTKSIMSMCEPAGKCRIGEPGGDGMRKFGISAHEPRENLYGISEPPGDGLRTFRFSEPPGDVMRKFRMSEPPGDGLRTFRFSKAPGDGLIISRFSERENLDLVRLQAMA